MLPDLAVDVNKIINEARIDFIKTSTALDPSAFKAIINYQIYAMKLVVFLNCCELIVT